MLWVYDHQSLSRDTNKFTFQLRFIMDVVKSGPTYRVKSREIPLSAHWPCAIIDRATAGGVGRFHNRKGAINVPCNDLNSWIIPAEDRRGFLSLSLLFRLFFSFIRRPLPSRVPLSRFNQRKSLTRMPPFDLGTKVAWWNFETFAWVSILELDNFEIRSGRTIDLSVKKRGNRGRYDIKLSSVYDVWRFFLWKWDYHAIIRLFFFFSLV